MISSRFLEVAGVAFRSRASCALPSGRLGCSWHILCLALASSRRILGSTPTTSSSNNEAPQGAGLHYFGGGGSRTRVLPRGREASTGLGGHSSCRGAGGGPSRFRLRIPLYFPPVPRARRGVSPGRVADRTRRSERGTAESVAIGAYAARARLPLLLAIESFAESRRSALHLRPAKRTVTVETGAPPIPTRYRPDRRGSRLCGALRAFYNAAAEDKALRVVEYR